MTISELQAEIERLRAERDALTVTSEEAVDIIRALHVERDEARAQAARLAEALQPFAAVQKAWMEEGRQSQIRMDWLTSVCEALASTDSLAWLNERKIAQLTELVEDMKHDRSIFEEHKWGWDAAMAYIEDTIAELRRKDD